MAKTFHHDNKKKRGEGVPLEIPLEGEKGLDGTPLIKIEKKVEEVRVMIQLTQASLKPKARRSDHIYFQLSLSNALERSNLISILGVPDNFKE
jgi:hypothetical protein